MSKFDSRMMEVDLGRPTLGVCRVFKNTLDED